VGVILGGAGLFNSGSGGGGGDFKPKTFRSMMPWYGLSAEIPWAAMETASTPSMQITVFAL